MVEPYRPLYTAKQAAEILLVNVSTVYDLMNKGDLPYLILGTIYRKPETRTAKQLSKGKTTL